MHSSGGQSRSINAGCGVWYENKYHVLYSSKLELVWLSDSTSAWQNTYPVTHALMWQQQRADMVIPRDQHTLCPWGRERASLHICCDSLASQPLWPCVHTGHTVLIITTHVGVTCVHRCVGQYMQQAPGLWSLPSPINTINTYAYHRGYTLWNTGFIHPSEHQW